ncbi:hypothetical protein CPB85DRAFT_556873 [Mucidula mucida]|nr:hypothetical protein CPB85DRAFT_556873 [Mucidula mucida]
MSAPSRSLSPLAMLLRSFFVTLLKLYMITSFLQPCSLNNRCRWPKIGAIYPFDVGLLICEMAGVPNNKASTSSLVVVSRSFRTCVRLFALPLSAYQYAERKTVRPINQLRKDPEFFKHTVKSLSINALHSLQSRREYPRSSIQEILAVCTGLTSFGCGMQEGNYAHLNEIMRTLHAASTNSTLLRIAISHLYGSHVDCHAIPSSIVHLHCSAGQMTC